MYYNYCIHVHTLALTILNRYPSKKLAQLNLKADAEKFTMEYKNISEIETIENRDSLKNAKDGIYIKKSQMYLDRYNIYERKTEVSTGYLWNKYTPNVQKVFIFSIMEESVPKTDLNEALLARSLSSIKLIKQSLNDKKIGDTVHDQLVKELASCLKKRRSALGE